MKGYVQVERVIIYLDDDQMISLMNFALLMQFYENVKNYEPYLQKDEMSLMN